jgi:hypothetical protein
MIDRDMMRPAQVEIEEAMRHLQQAATCIMESETHPSMAFADPGLRREYESLFDSCMDAIPVLAKIKSSMSCLMAIGA